MQGRRQVQDLLKKQKKSSKKDKSHESKKKLKEEVVPHKLKIKGVVFAGDGGQKVPSNDESNNSGGVASRHDNSSGDKKNTQIQRKLLDDEI